MKNSPHASINDDLRQILDTCVTELPKLILHLASVIRDREDEFLQLGSVVFSFNSKANAFSKSASDIAHSVAQDTLKNALLELQGRVLETQDLFTSDSSTRYLKEETIKILNYIEQLTRATNQFENMVRSLKVLEIATRIESAHLGHSGAEFSTLADDVKSLSAKIAQNTDTIYENTDHLQKNVTATHKQGQDQAQRQSIQVRNIFTKLDGGIEQLEQMRISTEVLVEDLAEGTAQVAKNMGQVVASVQFHDITRQQVEHVQEILDQVPQEIFNIKDDNDIIIVSAWTRDVLRLQISQLEQTRTIFFQAVEDLMSNLNIIAQHIDDLCNRITSVVYSGTGQSSTLDVISEHIAQVVTATHIVNEQTLEMSQSMINMAETISTVGEFVDDIEEIGTEIELIALNANIKAAHTGDQGRALGVLAVEIQELSAQSQTHTNKVTEILNSVADIAQNMILAAQQSEMVEKTTEMQTTFAEILTRLNDLDQNLRENIAGLLDLGQVLVKDMKELIDSIQVHREVANELSDLEENLTDLLKAFTPFHDILESARQPDKLRKQLTRYTMDSERLVHLAVLGDEKELSAEDEDVLLFETDEVKLFDSSSQVFEIKNDDVELFDDNIELFDSPKPDQDNDPIVEEQKNISDENIEDDDEFGDNVELF